MDVTLYHGSACGIARDTPALIRAASIEPAILDELKTRWYARRSPG